METPRDRGGDAPGYAGLFQKKVQDRFKNLIKSQDLRLSSKRCATRRKPLIQIDLAVAVAVNNREEPLNCVRIYAAPSVLRERVDDECKLFGTDHTITIQIPMAEHRRGRVYFGGGRPFEPVDR